MSEPIRVLLVEDHLITRIGLRMILLSAQNLSIVDEADDGQKALDKALALKPQVVLMDIGLPLLDGVECARRIKLSNPNIGILVRSSHEEARTVLDALNAGCDGYCLKDSTDDVLIRAISVVAVGRIWIDPRIAALLLNYALRPEPGPLRRYTAAGSTASALALDEIDLLTNLSAGNTYPRQPQGVESDGDATHGEPSQHSEILRRALQKLAALS